MADWIAAATSYSVHGVPMIPFYIYYSMFGFQRVGDLAWAAGDSRARGFMLGGTAGRTTLNGEGLQHEDGHSHILAGTIPNCITYDPAFAYEVAVIIQDGLRRMFVDQEDVYYYLTVCNENYHHPAMPEGVEQGIIKGLYRFSKAEKPADKHVNLMSSGTIFQQAMQAAEMLKADFGITADLWVATSMNELAREAQDVERSNRMYPTSAPKVPYVTEALGQAHRAGDRGHRLHEELRRADPRLRAAARTTSLGTDGFGRSDSRVNAAAALRGRRQPHRGDRGLRALQGRQGHRRRGRGGLREVRDRPDQDQPAHRRERRTGETQYGNDRSQGAGHRRFQGRAGHQRDGEARRHRREGRPAASSSSPTRRRWRCRPPRAAPSRRSGSRRATRSPRAC